MPAACFRSFSDEFFEHFREIPQLGVVGVAAVLRELHFRDVEQQTAAVTGLGREADDFQIGVDFRAVVDEFERFAVERGAFVAFEPLAVHVREHTSERVADQLVQRHFFELRERRVCVPENPVYGVFAVVKHHFDVGERNRQLVKAAVVAVQRVVRHGRRFAVEAADELLALFVQLGDQLLLAPRHVADALAVVEVHLVGDVVDGQNRHQSTAMRLEKAFSEHFFELFERNQRFVAFAARGVYLREVFVHLNVQNGADIE